MLRLTNEKIFQIKIWRRICGNHNRIMRVPSPIYISFLNCLFYKSIYKNSNSNIIFWCYDVNYKFTENLRPIYKLLLKKIVFLKSLECMQFVKLLDHIWPYLRNIKSILKKEHSTRTSLSRCSSI